MGKLYLFCKKIHRILVLIIMAIGLVMTLTGLAMKYPTIIAEHASWLNVGMLRYVHNMLSLYFSIVLLLMVCTGLVMYFYPTYAQRKARLNSQKHTEERQPQ